MNIGFDIGVSSIGWTVLSAKSGKVLETGVRVFSSADPLENTERRRARQARRLIRRRKTRLRDLKQVLAQFNFPYPTKHIKEIITPYELRVKGLTEKLTREELAIALYHLVKRRGISYDLEDVEEEVSGGVSYQESLKENQYLLQNKTPGEIQLERLDTLGKVRGEVFDSETNNVYFNVFPSEAYQKEAEQILKQQQFFYPEITLEMITEVNELILRKRDYFKGPGSKKSSTNYGIYKTDGTVLNNLFETLIGKDKIFPEEYRAATNSYTAQVFDVLEDLTKLTVSSTKDGKLSAEHKEIILAELKGTTKSVNILQLISKVAQTESEEIKGYRLTREGKPKINSLANYRNIKKKLLKENIDISDWPNDLLDELGRILTLNTENGEIRRFLENPNFQEAYPVLKAIDLDKIVKNKDWFTRGIQQRWHRYSLKTMKLLIPELIRSNQSEEYLLKKLGLLDEQENRYLNQTELDLEYLSKNIYNPMVNKAVRQMAKIFNELYKKYPTIDFITLEMPRDDSEEEIKKRSQQFKKKVDLEKERAFSEFASKAEIDEEQLWGKIYRSKHLLTKIRLWYQQQGECLYSAEEIDATLLLKNPEQYEINPILPTSLCFDDSLNNKVLCSLEVAKLKDQQTPYEMIIEGKGRSFEDFKKQVEQMKRLDKRKKDYLLLTSNLLEPEVARSFILRNLIDMRYVSRIVFNEFQQFIKGNQLETQVAIVRGKFTSLLRRKWDLERDYETYHYYAMKAAVLAVIPTLDIWDKLDVVFIPKRVQGRDVTILASKRLHQTEFEAATFNEPYLNFIEEVRQLTLPIEKKQLSQHSYRKMVKFSHQVNKKVNRKISDATLYATRLQKLNKDKEVTDYILGKIKNIYTFSGYQKFAKIYEKDKARFLMYHHDPQTFKKLEKVLEEYLPKDQNGVSGERVKKLSMSPFERYRQEHGYLKKYAKKGDGPIIRQMKFYDKQLGTHLDITPDEAKGRKVILQSLKQWRTDVYYNHTTEKYEIMGIKYSDLSFNEKNQYGLFLEQYEKIKIEEQVSAKAEFMFSLYRNDRIKIIDLVKDEEVELLFGSRNSPNKKGYVELKPINKPRFSKNERLPVYGKVAASGQFIKRLYQANCLIFKVNTDILGNPYYISREGKHPKYLIDNKRTFC